MLNMKGTIFAAVLFFLVLSLQCAVYDAKNASAKIKKPYMCTQGIPGLPGSNGVNGHNGLPGRDGRDGAKGKQGAAGPPGPSGAEGRVGQDGAKGKKGERGSPGQRGVKGETGARGRTGNTPQRNWKQCAWKTEAGRDVGLIKDCQFTKTRDDTALHVVFQGNIYLGGCGNCCKRWFITFNGAECSGPMPIDAALWIRSSGEDNHRPGAIEGYCNNIHKGKIRVGINIGNCAGYGNSNGVTGWNSVSRLIIEEASRSQ